jgi:transposase
MRRFVEGTDRGQSTLFPECLEDWIGQDNPVRAIDVFVDELDLAELGFGGADPEATGRPSYHPSVLLKLYIYGYLNRVQSSRFQRDNLRRHFRVRVLHAQPRSRLCESRHSETEFASGLSAGLSWLEDDKVRVS